VITHREFSSLLDSSAAIRTAILKGLAGRLQSLEPNAPG
jgi:hypothetical protein